ncbi:MAG: DUF502 domain-containing protein [Endomicrobium sp.]|jgi:uncharacterized membrane protein|nr:DUF502 domain-containing protein [Endomicrobium sp.]
MENKEEEIKTKKTIKERFGILIKRYMTTGLIIIIPLWLTFFVVKIIFNWVSSFTYPALFPVLSHYILDKSWIHLLIKASSFIISIASICFLGFIANKFIGKSVLNFFERLINNVPLVGTVYSSAKQFIHFLFGKDKDKGFKKVVFIPYPQTGVYCAAFLTGRQNIKGEEHVCVFMPTTPNPTTGFLLMYKEEDIVHTNYTIDQAFQFIMSMGVINMDKNVKIGRKKNEL